MMQRTYPDRAWSVTVSLLIILSLVSGMTYFYSAGSARAAAPHSIRTHRIGVEPRYRTLGTVSGHISLGQSTFDCLRSAAIPRCYTVQQIRRAYDITRVLKAGYEGQGRTIVIIDAYQDPTMAQDLQTFDQLFNLPEANLDVVAPDGLTPFNASSSEQVNWASEIALDVEWAHAIAPLAHLELVLARSSQDKDIFSATKYAIDNNLGDVISQSYGEAEACVDSTLLQQEHQAFQQATNEGITLLASSGDSGAAEPTCDNTSYSQSVSSPASDPLVTAVGGTYLNAAASTGKYLGEASWNDSYGASGGGYSTIYTRPVYQKGFNNQVMRGVPDIAYDADVNGGFITIWNSSGQGTNNAFIFGGTSAGTPQWAAIVALADEYAGGRIGLINTLLYQKLATANYHAFFHDITIGNNTYTTTDSKGNVVSIAGYDTLRGWDAITGLGTPITGNCLFGTYRAGIKAVKNAHV